MTTVEPGLAAAAAEARASMRERAALVVAQAEVRVEAARRRERFARGAIVTIVVLAVTATGAALARQLAAPDPFGDRLAAALDGHDHATLSALAVDRAAVMVADRPVPGALVRRAMRDCDSTAARMLERAGAARVIPQPRSAPVDVALSTAIRYCGPATVVTAWASSPARPSGIEVMTDAAAFGHATTVRALAALGLPLEGTSAGASALEAAIEAGRTDNVEVLIDLGADVRYRTAEGLPLDWLIPRLARRPQHP